MSQPPYDHARLVCDSQRAIDESRRLLARLKGEEEESMLTKYPALMTLIVRRPTDNVVPFHRPSPE